jgi:hypothetical protein
MRPICRRASRASSNPKVFGTEYPINDYQPMRDFHAFCVKIYRRNKKRRRVGGVFAENGVALAVLIF